MAGNQNDRQADIFAKDTTGPAAAIGKAVDSRAAADVRNAGWALADEKATANAKHARASSVSKSEPLGDALALGGGQQSTPYQLETQADAIAKQTRRGDV